MLLVAALAVAYLLPGLKTTQIIALGGGIVFFIICLASTEAALYLLIFSMLLSPEIIVGATKGGASLGRGVTLRLDDFLMLILGFTWLAKMAVNKDLGMFLKTPLNKPIAYYIIICLISTLFGAVFGDVNLMTGLFFVLKYFQYVLIYFMVVNHLQRRDQARNYLWAMLIVCAIVSIIGIIQIPGGERVSAPFEGDIGEPNTFGGYLVFMFCITAGLLLTTTSLRARWIYVILMTLFVIPLIYTQSRSSYIAFFGAALIFVWLSEKRFWILPMFIFVGLLLPFIAPEIAKKRVAFTFSQPEERGQIQVGGVRIDTSTSARLIIMQTVAKDWIKRPVFGFGITGYRFVDIQYPRVLIETGGLGLVTFVLLILTIFKRSYQVFREADEPMERGLSMGFVAGFVGLLFHALGANTFIIVRIMEPFWFVLAMVIMLPNLKSEPPKRQSM
jgi:hypothetical protein